MKKITVELDNCYGIKRLRATFDFTSHRTYAIYAPNGAMKSSFADTFKDVAEGKASSDRVFPERQSNRKIVDEAGATLPAQAVMVIRNYEDFPGSNEEMATLLVNQELRTEYEKLHRDLARVKALFLAAIKEQSSSKQDLESEISNAIMLRDKQFYEALDRVRKEVSSQTDAPFGDINYDVIFNDKVRDVLDKKDFKIAIDSYVKRYNELMDRSTYFKRGVFNYYNASQIAKTLAANGFFDAQHSVTLNAETSIEIKDVEQLEALITHELEGIANDSKLRQKFAELQKLLEKNKEAREFRDYITTRDHVLPQLANISAFKQDLFKSYFKARFELYNDLLQEYDRVLESTKDIEEKAKKQQTQWQAAINTFNTRFYVPFKLQVVNLVDVMLGRERLPILGYVYVDGREEMSLQRENVLRVLSTGEKKALYILNLVFEIERRKSARQETIFIVDDIADSFDYKNKYAIIQYLKDISEEVYFYQVVLTHNFDFFRTIQSRGLVTYPHCIMASRTDTGVVLKQAEGIKNPFVLDWKPKFRADDRRKIACIPFMRNLIEYTKGVTDADYKTLTALLHWKDGSATISENDLLGVYARLFGGSAASKNGKRTMVSIIEREANNCLAATDTMDLVNKIILSVATRLSAERFMISRLSDSSFVQGIEDNQTQKLLTEYKRRFVGDPASDVLDLVILMTPENIHLNSFMYEPILDMGVDHLRDLYCRVTTLTAGKVP
jgi:hypothetical protein